MRKLPGIVDEVDYSIYPGYKPSIGFLTRGCRLKCGFCVVPRKEGLPFRERSVQTLWRGEGHSRELMLLDNDFFGIPDWRRHISDIRSGGFKVCFSQGVNIRLVNPALARALSTVDYRDTKFGRRRLYCAWDNIGDEKVFFRGVRYLNEAGIPSPHLMVYMLIGYAGRRDDGGCSIPVRSSRRCRMLAISDGL